MKSTSKIQHVISINTSNYLLITSAYFTFIQRAIGSGKQILLSKKDIMFGYNDKKTDLKIEPH